MSLWPKSCGIGGGGWKQYLFNDDVKFFVYKKGSIPFPLWQTTRRFCRSVMVLFRPIPVHHPPQGLSHFHLLSVSASRSILQFVVRQHNPPPPLTWWWSGAKKGYVLTKNDGPTSPWANTMPSWVPTTLCYGSSEFNLYQWIRTPPLVYLSVNQLLARPNWCQCDTSTCPRHKLLAVWIRGLHLWLFTHRIDT